MASSSEISHHLDEAATHGYLDSINGTTPESLIDAQMKVAAFIEAIPETITLPILTIGLGQGEEAHALSSSQIPLIGLDIAKSSIDRTQERSALHNFYIPLVRADAQKLPFRAGSFGGIIMSSVLHEVYSYCQPSGFESFQNTLGEAAVALCDGGVLYIREFGCPSPRESPIQIVPISEQAKEFCDYFAGAFSLGIADEGETDNIELSLDKNGETKTIGDTTQILLHFKNYWHDLQKKAIKPSPADWKEAKESYLIKKPGPDRQYLDPVQLCAETQAAAAMAGQILDLKELRLIHRTKINLFLQQHFAILNHEGDDVSQHIIPQSTAKIEAIFTKKPA